MATQFDGLDDYLKAGWTGIGGSTNRTICAWIRTSANGFRYHIVSWGNAGPYGSRWCFKIDDVMWGGALSVEVYGGKSQGTTSVNDGEWHHVACVLNGGSTSDIDFYVDGSLEAIQGLEARTIATTTDQNVAIGCRGHDNAEVFLGDIADISVYDRALSADEIADMAGVKRRLPRYYFDSSLQLYVPLVGPTGVTISAGHWGAKDLSGNGRHIITVTSAPKWDADPLAPQAWAEGPFGGAMMAPASYVDGAATLLGVGSLQAAGEVAAYVDAAAALLGEAALTARGVVVTPPPSVPLLKTTTLGHVAMRGETL